MKSLSAIIILTFFSVAVFAQEFSFQLVFVSTTGQRDTVILGYDLQGTDTIDALFGEENIFNQPYDSILDVRASNYDVPYYGYSGSTIVYQTKTQIVGVNCPFSWLTFQSTLIELDIKSKYWPIKAYWNKILFMDSCRSGSVLTSVSPGGWWDTGGQQVILVDADSATLVPSYYKYIQGNDTLNLFWVGLGGDEIISVGIDPTTVHAGDVIIYPNPIHQTETLEYTLTKNESLTIALYDVNGRLIRNFISNEQRAAGDHKETLNMGELTSGDYFLTLSNGEEKMSVQMVKQ